MADSKKRYWVGFDLGGTKMLAKVFDTSFKELARVRKKTKAQEGSASGLERMIGLTREAIDEAGLAVDDISGIGMGCPGPLDLNKGVLLDLPNLGWKDVAVKKAMQKAFGCPVAIINDVDAGTYGEYRFGAGRKSRCALGVFPGTGIGGGCVTDGHLIRGKVNSCMEIGHMTVDPDGALCGCGKRGCLETVASRLAVASAAAVAAHRGEAPALLVQAGMGLADIKSGALARSIEAGDATVELIVRRAAQWLGLAVGNVVNLLAPDVVILGGGMVEAMPELYVAETLQAANAHAMPSFRGTFKVVAAALGDEATAMGAAAWAQQLEKDGN